MVRGQSALSRPEEMTVERKKNRYFYIAWILIFMTGVLLRVLYLTGYPAGVNAGEAYDEAALNFFSDMYDGGIALSKRLH